MSQLTWHKNDQVDASIIAEYVRLHGVPIYKPIIKNLQALYRCFEDLKTLHLQAINHLEHAKIQVIIDVWQNVKKETEAKILDVFSINKANNFRFK